MLTWKDMEVEELRRNEIHREVKKYRLIQQLRSSKSRTANSLLSRAAMWLATHLIEWGLVLVERYGNSSPRPA
ncbi:MAG: hypothetical protein GTO18_06580 [Anaerolineales bacterium]|nr:hypothetical protein [Anaerolineales bacterium]